MRHLRRPSILAAATVLTGATALAGSGPAGAQDSIPWTLNSPSTVTVERGEGGEIVLSYDNRSGHDLLCYAYVGTPKTVENIYGANVKWGFRGRLNVIAPPSDIGVIGFELGNGRGDVVAFAPTVGASGPVTSVSPVEGEYGEVVLVPAPPPELPDTSFRPQVVTVCAHSEGGAEEYTYAELERSPAGGDTGAGGVLGSLASLTSAFGS